MRHFLKGSSSTRPTNGSSPRTPPSPIVGPVNQALTRIDPRVKGVGVLAASTSAIALSIGSPSSDLTDTASEEPGSSKESCWGTAYEAAKIAIDVAKESSDMFLPLKAVVGALSVLIKNHDVRFSRVSRPIEY